jgi:hypothetical protein
MRSLGHMEDPPPHPPSGTRWTQAPSLQFIGVDLPMPSKTHVPHRPMRAGVQRVRFAEHIRVNFGERQGRRPDAPLVVSFSYKLNPHEQLMLTNVIVDEAEDYPRHLRTG